MGKRRRKRLKRIKRRIMEALKARRCKFGCWKIPERTRVVEWSHLTDTIRDENSR
jgi:hypothetical protein